MNANRSAPPEAPPLTSLLEETIAERVEQELKSCLDPVMDGYELAARLRALPELAGIRLIALTGYGQESDREKTRAAGFDHHLVKPVDFDAVEAVVSGFSKPA